MSARVLRPKFPEQRIKPDVGAVARVLDTIQDDDASALFGAAVAGMLRAQTNVCDKGDRRQTVTALMLAFCALGKMLSLSVEDCEGAIVDLAR